MDSERISGNVTLGTDYSEESLRSYESYESPYMPDILRDQAERKRKGEEMTIPPKPETPPELKPGYSLWRDICRERERVKDFLLHIGQLPRQLEMPNQDSVAGYLYQHIFPNLLPAMESALYRAMEWDCQLIQKCAFNGLDHIAEVLWNRNKMHPERQEEAWKGIYDIPFVQQYLAEHPRPYFPKSWLWTREKAAKVIQSTFRGYLVRREPAVQEMRLFWVAIRKEKKKDDRQRKRKEAEAVAYRAFWDRNFDDMCRLNAERDRLDLEHERHFRDMTFENMCKQTKLFEELRAELMRLQGSSESIDSSPEGSSSSSMKINDVSAILHEFDAYLMTRKIIPPAPTPQNSMVSLPEPEVRSGYPHFWGGESSQVAPKPSQVSGSAINK